MRHGSSVDGNSAKGSFLLAVLSNPNSSAPEKAIAFLSLIDDIDNVCRSMRHDDFNQIRDCLDEVFKSMAPNAAWSISLFPDDSLATEDAIEGKFIKCVTVPPSEATEDWFDILRVNLSPGKCYTVTSEYTFESDGGSAVLEVVDSSTNYVLGTIRLEKGNNQFAITTIDIEAGADEKTVIIRIANNSSSIPVFWYQTNIHALVDPEHVTSVSEAFCEALQKRRAIKAPSIFQPVTGEPLTITDIERLNTLKNKFSGERIFIMGNGPSLNKTPLELLKNDYVFGLNRISLLFERVSWRPTFFTAFDVRVVPDNKKEFADLDVPYKFFSARYKEMMGEKDSHYWYHTKGFYEGFDTCFDPNVAYSGFGGGGTIAVIAIELAFFMGFREIYLIGTDVSYSVPKTVIQTGKDVFGDGVKLELESTRDDDQNHFDPRYFGRGQKWHNPNVRDMKVGFSRAASYVEHRGGILRNATVGGMLDEVQRIDFESLF